MEGAFGLFLIIAIVISVAYRLHKINKLKKDSIEAMPDDEPPMDEVQSEDFNGQDLFIREEERRVWESLSRKQKRWVLNEQRKAIKKGMYLRTIDGRLITRADARKNGLI